MHEEGARDTAHGTRKTRWQVPQEFKPFVTPAEAGVQRSQEKLDSRLRGNDGKDGEKRFFRILPVL
jgi:hypothetical protein